MPPKFQHSLFKFKLLRQLSKVIRAYHLTTLGEYLRRLYSPKLLQRLYRTNQPISGLFEVVSEYDNNLLIHVNTSSLLEWSIFVYGYHEPEICNLIKRLVKPGYVVMDVGANIGAHTLIMAQAVGITGKVIAIEPNPKVHERLVSNLYLNRFDHVQPLQCGLSDTSGQMILHIPPDHLANQGIASLYPQAELSVQIPVQIHLLDEIVTSLACQQLDFIKIDTEGHDMKVILGAEKSIETYQPYILFEYIEKDWYKTGLNFSSCEKFFTHHEYMLYIIHSSNFLTKLADGLPESTNILAVPTRIQRGF